MFEQKRPSYIGNPQSEKTEDSKRVCFYHCVDVSGTTMVRVCNRCSAMTASNHSTYCCVQVPMKEQALAECKDTVHEALRKLSEQDRDVMEKGIKAFVSFVRAYKEHQCKFIFRLADLDLAQLATALGLLRLPKMPEMRKTKQRLEGFTPSTLDPNDVKVSFLQSFIPLCVSGLPFEEAFAVIAVVV